MWVMMIGGMDTVTSLSDGLVFLAAVLRRPSVMGAVAPSSRGLSEQVASVVPRLGRPTVLELGAGTGAVSTVVSQRLPPGGRLLAVEIDSMLADRLQRAHPEVTVLHGDAAELGALLASAGASQVDAVVCSLPWSLFSAELQHQILAQVCQALAPGAAFSTFAYRHAMPLAGARRFRALLADYFDEVMITRTVWRNLPPASVYVCRRPIRGST